VKLDSMKTESRRIKDQVDALSAENRTLTARNAELETKLNEATAATKAPAVSSAPIGDVTGAYNTHWANSRGGISRRR